jgi:hypothetical protein
VLEAQPISWHERREKMEKFMGMCELLRVLRNFCATPDAM